MSYRGLIVKLQSIGVSGSCCPLIGSSSPTAGSEHGDTSEWIPMVSGVPQGSVLGPLLFILYIHEMVENRLYAYVDDWNL